MKRVLIVAAFVAALAIPAAASAAGNTVCSGDMSGKTITTNVSVPAGTTCNLSWSDVQGNVSINGRVETYGKTHFGSNVTVNPGGSFAAANWGVTIDGNLSFTDPGTYSYNGFWGDYSPNVVHGNVTYKITSAVAYPDYQSPLLYFGGGVKVDGTFTYSDQGTGFPGHLDTTGLTARNFS